MKKRNLAGLAMLGISAGLLVAGCQDKNGNGNGNGNHKSNNHRMNPDMQAFHNSLSPSAQKQFMEMDAQHKMMAMEMANQSCNGQNKCKGMGGCKNENNSCAGHNACKGQGGAPVKDPNKAVEVQHQNMMEHGNNNGNGMRRLKEGAQDMHENLQDRWEEGKEMIREHTSTSVTPHQKGGYSPGYQEGAATDYMKKN